MIRMATLNLYHWAAPGIWWYARRDANSEGDDQSVHDASSWNGKQAWLRSLLGDMDADLVGFQEVVSVDSLRELCADEGYSHFATVDEPIIEGGDVYVRPVQALASRTPFEAEAFAAPEGFAEEAGLKPDWRIRRPAVKAVLALPGVGKTLVYVCHLKSKGAEPRNLRFEERTPLQRQVRDTVAAISRGHVKATMQRTAEASALYHEALARVAEDPDRPIVVMGDLNDDPGSPALEALAATSSPKSIGGVDLADIDPASRAAIADHVERCRLFDAWRLCPRDPLREARRDTHIGSRGASVLDYILVSNALNPHNPDAVASVVRHQVYSAHFRGIGGDASSSDHAAVVVEIAPRQTA